MESWILFWIGLIAGVIATKLYEKIRKEYVEVKHEDL